MRFAIDSLLVLGPEPFLSGGIPLVPGLISLLLTLEWEGEQTLHGLYQLVP